MQINSFSVPVPGAIKTLSERINKLRASRTDKAGRAAVRATKAPLGKRITGATVRSAEIIGQGAASGGAGMGVAMVNEIAKIRDHLLKLVEDLQDAGELPGGSILEDVKNGVLWNNKSLQRIDLNTLLVMISGIKAIRMYSVSSVEEGKGFIASILPTARPITAFASIRIAGSTSKSIAGVAGDTRVVQKTDIAAMTATGLAKPENGLWPIDAVVFEGVEPRLAFDTQALLTVAATAAAVLHGNLWLKAGALVTERVKQALSLPFGSDFVF